MLRLSRGSRKNCCSVDVVAIEGRPTAVLIEPRDCVLEAQISNHLFYCLECADLLCDVFRRVSVSAQDGFSCKHAFVGITVANERDAEESARDRLVDETVVGDQHFDRRVRARGVHP